MFSDTQLDTQPLAPSPAPRIPRIHPAPAEASTDVGHDDGGSGLPGPAMALVMAVGLVALVAGVSLALWHLAPYLPEWLR